MIYFFTVYLIFLYLVSSYILNNKKLINNNLLEHQIFINRSVPLVGGIFLLFPVFFFFSSLNKFTLFIYFNLFLLGTLSDFNYLSSAKKRFLIQIGIVVFFVFMSKLEVTPTRIEVIDNLFNNSIVSYTFTAFCLLILINGSNFIDGLNGLLLSYFTLILIFLLKLDLLEILVQDNFKIILFLILCIFLLLLNFSNKIFMGDNGAYSIGFLFGLILIKIYNINSNISPYFIILLLWYPCFEIFFSLLRKLLEKKNPLNPDNKHLHHFIFLSLKNKFKISNMKSNNISSVIINLYNCLLFYVASQKIYNTSFQVILLAISVVIYISAYLKMRNKSSF